MLGAAVVLYQGVAVVAGSHLYICAWKMDKENDGDRYWTGE